MEAEYSEKLLETVGNTADSAGNQAVLQKVYRGLIEGNYDVLRGAATENIEFRMSGLEQMNGHWQGHDEVIAATRRNFGLVNAQQPVVEKMISDGDCVAVLMQEKGRMTSTGAPYSVRVVQWFTFEGGKISKIEQIAASVP